MVLVEEQLSSRTLPDEDDAAGSRRLAASAQAPADGAVDKCDDTRRVGPAGGAHIGYGSRVPAIRAVTLIPASRSIASAS